MSQSIRRFRLNPCDCLFHAFDHLVRRAGYGGAATWMVLEAVGKLPAATLTAALTRAMAAHPVTMGRAATTRWRAWPCWEYDGRPVPPAYEEVDLSGAADWQTRAHAWGEAALSRAWDPTQPPLVRVYHCRGPAEQHRIYFGWKHALMDAEGAQWFLAETNRLAAVDGPDGASPLLPDEQPPDPLAGTSLLQRARLMRRGVRERAAGPPGTQPGLGGALPDRPVDSRGLRFLARTWSGDDFARLAALAQATVPPGPALYTRHLAVSVLRAVARLHHELGQPLVHHRLMLPMRLPGLARRALWGNYLVGAPMYFAAEHIEDRRALAGDVSAQLARYVGGDSPRATWALQTLTAGLRVGQYRRLIEWQLRGQWYVTGFSVVSRIEPPLPHFLGATLTNIHVGGVVSIPPGWNVTFSRFGERMNMLLAWPEAEFPNAVVMRYADLIVAEALGR